MLNEYKPLKLPSGMTEGYIFSIASSRQLNIFGEQVGIKRRKFLFVKEPDFLFKTRIRNRSIKLKRRKSNENCY